MTPLDCSAAEQLFSDYLSGSLPDDAQVQLGQHLQSCDACRARGVALARQDRALTEFAAQSRLPALRQSIRQALQRETRPLAATRSSPAPARPRRRKSTRTRSGGTFFTLLAAAGVCLVLGLFVYQRANRQDAEPLALLEAINGAVTLSRGGQPVPLDYTPDRPMPLRAGDTLSVAEGAQATLGYPSEGTTVLLDAGSTMRIDAAAPGKRVHLAAGTLNARVAPQPPGKPMIFTTPLAQAEVLGTALELNASATQTRLEVSEGNVRLQRGSDKASVDVAANFFAVANATSPLAALPVQQAPLPPTREQRKRLISQAEQKELQQRAAQRREAVLAAVKLFTEQTSQGPKGTMKYRLFAPAAAAGRKLPVVLFLHGTGGGGRDNKKQLDDQPFGAGLWVLPENQQRFPCIVLAPQTGGGWEGNAHQLALQCLDDVLKSQPADLARVYVTGLSAGGFGAFACLQVRPQQFAAAIALSGWLPDPNRVKEYAHVPVWILHGSSDTVINVQHSRRAFDVFSKAGADVRYDEFDTAPHGIFAAAYNTPDMIEWLFARVKPEAPAK